MGEPRANKPGLFDARDDHGRRVTVGSAGPDGERRITFVGWLMIAIGAIVVFDVTMVLTNGGREPWTLFVTSGTAFVVPWLLLMMLIEFKFLRPARGARSEIGMALAAKRCPSCAYSLRGLAEGEDGCRVCPECGAAWRVPSPEQTES